MDGIGRFPRTAGVIEHGLNDQTHIGAQVYISLHGKVCADFAVGEARPGSPMTTGTLMLWLSACKPVTAVAIARLWELGKLDLDDRVAAIIPEFNCSGKEQVTIRHILTHTAGLRWVETGWPTASWNDIITRLCAMRHEPRWVPGAKAGYHAFTSWFLLGEIVRRLDGRPIEDFVREEIFLPAGMSNSWLALPSDRFQAYGSQVGVLQNTEVVPCRPLGFDTEQAAGACRPSGSGRGPVRELGWFYEMLLAGGCRGGRRVVSPQTVAALTARHRVGMVAHRFQQRIDWGLGFLIDSKHYAQPALSYGYGVHASPRTFGHSGFQSSCAFADPEYGLVVAWICNGAPGEDRHQPRQSAINAAIYEDLELVEGSATSSTDHDQ